MKTQPSPSRFRPAPWPGGIYPVIFIVTLAAYLPALRAGFIWNDRDYVTAPALRSWHGLGRIWFQVGATEQYYPILHSAFWIEHRLWGDAPLGYHLLNVCLHAACACLLVMLVRQLRLPGAGWAGLIFALHPVCVESVAWISEEKNTLSTVFYLLAGLAYLRSREEEAPASRYALATAWFLLALLSKSVTATLPAALLLVAWRQAGRLAWKRDVAPLLPWFALGAGAGLFTAWVERIYVGAHGEAYDLSLVQRGLLAGRVTWFYIGKLVWPAHLIFIYPRWSIRPAEFRDWMPALAAGATTVGLGWRAWAAGGSRARSAFCAWAIFCVSLFPVLGFLNIYAFRYSFVADHWQYLPCIGLIVLAAAIAAEVRFLALAAVALCGLLTWRQARIYRDPETLYRTTLADNPGCWMASHNLASLLLESNRVEEAVAQFEATLRIEPGFADSENNLGIALERMGKFQEAVQHLRTAIRLQPDYAEANYNLGEALLDLQRPGEALAPLESLVRLRPAVADGWAELGTCLARLGRTGEAIPSFEQAIRIDPSTPEPHRNLGLALADVDRWDEAISQFETAIRLRPDYADAHFRLALALWHVGRREEAVAQREAALRLDPALPQ